MDHVFPQRRSGAEEKMELRKSGKKGRFIGMGPHEAALRCLEELPLAGKAVETFFTRIHRCALPASLPLWLLLSLRLRRILQGVLKIP
jgi:hypothetical protein